MLGIPCRRNQGVLDLQQRIRRRGRIGYLDWPPLENGRHAKPTNGDGTTATEKESVATNHQCPQQDRARLLWSVRPMPTTDFRRPLGSFSGNSDLCELRLEAVLRYKCEFTLKSWIYAVLFSSNDLTAAKQTLDVMRMKKIKVFLCLFTLLSGCGTDREGNDGNATERKRQVRGTLDNDDSHLGTRLEFDDNATLAKILDTAIQINKLQFREVGGLKIYYSGISASAQSPHTGFRKN